MESVRTGFNSLSINTCLAFLIAMSAEPLVNHELSPLPQSAHSHDLTGQPTGRWRCIGVRSGACYFNSRSWHTVQLSAGAHRHCLSSAVVSIEVHAGACGMWPNFSYCEAHEFTHETVRDWEARFAPIFKGSVARETTWTCIGSRPLHNPTVTRHQPPPSGCPMHVTVFCSPYKRKGKVATSLVC